MFFDTDGLRRPTSGPRDLEPTGVRITLNGTPSSKTRTIRVRIGEELARRMHWISGDRLLIGFKRDEKIMGITRSNVPQANAAQTSRLQDGSKSQTAGIHVTMSVTRIADDLRQPVIDWVGDGVAINKPLVNSDAVYWIMEPRPDKAP